MTVQAYPKFRLSTRTKPHADLKPERLEACPLQEQFTGPVPLRNERPAADVLAERLAGADPASTSLIFIP